ncbi:hypothetical protein HG848_002977 [Salmonella enterica]|nr:hypothetical protein [Salmonella enterica]EGO6456654.1 hypothetical protein [Salmonella enterica]EHB0826851.1 hypothetical protein [Salmonella enterica]EIG0048036.1 hypothetical protein [Salmonella enterica]
MSNKFIKDYSCFVSYCKNNSASLRSLGKIPNG